MHSIWYGRLIARLDDIRKDSIAYITEGGALDFAAYRYHVGYLKGLEDARQLAEEVDNEQLGFSTNAPRHSATND